MTQKKKQSRPTPLPSRSLTGRFRTHAPQQCALSRRSRVTQVTSEYPAMLCRSHLVSGGSVASARPLGTVRTLYPDIMGRVKGVPQMTDLDHPNHRRSRQAPQPSLMPADPPSSSPQALDASDSIRGRPARDAPPRRGSRRLDRLRPGKHALFAKHDLPTTFRSGSSRSWAAATVTSRSSTPSPWRSCSASVPGWGPSPTAAAAPAAAHHRRPPAAAC